jgi:hypothetical protein
LGFARSELKALGLRVAVGVFAIWLAAGLVVGAVLPDWTARGSFGDMFGAVNALFAGLAFAGVILTMALQGRELEFQRQELELTRQELRRSANAQERSEQALARQLAVLELTARLNAVNALVGYTLQAHAAEGDAGERLKLREELRRYGDVLRVTYEERIAPDSTTREA